MMVREPDRPLRQPELRLHRRRTRSRRRSCSACAARPATRSTTARATGCRTTRPQVFVAKVDVRVGRRLRPRRGARAARRRASTRSAAWSRTSACSTSRRRTTACGSSPCTRACRWTRSSKQTGFELAHPAERARDARADRRGAAPDPRGASTPKAARDREVRAVGAPCLVAPSTPGSATCSAVAVPIVQTGMGWVATPELTAAACERGRLRLPRRRDDPRPRRSTPRSRA